LQIFKICKLYGLNNHQYSFKIINNHSKSFSRGEKITFGDLPWWESQNMKALCSLRSLPGFFISALLSSEALESLRNKKARSGSRRKRLSSFGRGEKIRTSDPHVPNVVR
jgi:hypothetical protein